MFHLTNFLQNQAPGFYIKQHTISTAIKLANTLYRMAGHSFREKIQAPLKDFQVPFPNLFQWRFTT